jgi:predicted dehydrogenase
MSTTPRISRRAALKRVAAAGLAAPFVFRAHAHAAPSETVYHASFGADGQALHDIVALTASKHLKLVAVADVDLNRTTEVRKRFPDVKVYQDWRELLDKEKNLNSANVTTPNHMHGPITMRAMQQGLNVYTQKPLTQTIYESRQLTRVAAEKQLVTQMGIQIHSQEAHRAVVALIQAGAIGRVKEVHSWSGKKYGDPNPRPNKQDDVPPGLNWDSWLGVAEEVPFIAGYYHPVVWRKRLDFGNGTFGDMGCHILDPVFTSLALGAPSAVVSLGGAANADNWALGLHVEYAFPATQYTSPLGLILHWYDSDNRPPRPIQALVGKRPLEYQGSIYLGSEGVLYSPYIDLPVLLPADKFRRYRIPRPGSDDHYLQFVEAVRGNGQTSAPFSYSGPLSEAVLLGCLATRFPQTPLQWKAADMTVANVRAANGLIRRQARKGWEVEGL